MEEQDIEQKDGKPDILVHLECNTPPISWNQFCRTHPPYSIALDGYVADSPHFDRGGPRLNANHHEHVDRLATVATCEQVLRLIRMGLAATFTKDGNLHAEVWVNDCDQDVCLSVWLLRHEPQVRAAHNPALNRLVALEGILDTTSGAYPFGVDFKALGDLAWVFEPYTKARAEGALARCDPNEQLGIIDAVGERIDQYLAGNGGHVNLDGRYKRCGGGADWVMLHEVGEHARQHAFADGVDAYISVAPLGGNMWRYTIGRRSSLINFDVPAILEMLDKEEHNPKTHWGGSDLIGGSPRGVGSRLQPEQVEALVKSFHG